MSQEQDDDFEESDSADEWQAEAEKWKQKAAEAERTAAENAGAAERLAALEKAQQGRDDEYAQQLLAAAEATDEQVKAARQDGAKTAAEWQAEAEKWKELAKKNEQLAKGSVGAARALEKLEAEKAEAAAKTTKVEAKAAETKADLEAKATQAELKAMRLSVAHELKVPTALVELLSGSSKREIEQSADKLLRELAANKAPEPEQTKAAEDQQKAKEDGELAEARKLLAEAEIKALRLEVATEKQLPSGLADMLNGRTREELDRQADALVAAIGGGRSETSTRARMPVSRLRPGALPDGANEPDADPQAVAESIMRRSRGY
ncbi:MAG TPA: hypothetical protein VF223_04790 [Trebonia sp.]